MSLSMVILKVIITHIKDNECFNSSKTYSVQGVVRTNTCGFPKFI